MESLFCFRKCNCGSLVVRLREETQANLLVMTTRMGSILAIAAVLLLSASGARAQTEITLLAPGPLGRETIDKLVANFEAKTGDKVKVTYGQGSRDTPPTGRGNWWRAGRRRTSLSFSRRIRRR